MSNTHQVEPAVQRQSSRAATSGVQPTSQLEFASDSTPAKRKLGSSLAYISTPQNYEKTREQLSDEMEGRWIGPMPVSEFLDTFLPNANVPLPQVAENPFQNVKMDGPDSARYAPFIGAIQEWIPGLQAVNTSNREDTANRLKLKTDISIYNGDQPVPNRTDFSQMELWVEFKSNDGVAFQDLEDATEESCRAAIESGSFIPGTKEGRSIRGQLANYAGSQHSQQFRNFSFSMLVETHQARFLRWDPSGTIVTAAFNYRTEPVLMAEFLWRFSHLCPNGRGHDPTVKPADLAPKDATRVREKLGITKEGTALYRYELPGMAGIGCAYGPKHSTQNRSLVSRCTRNLPVVWIPVHDGCVPGSSSTSSGDINPHISSHPNANGNPWSEEQIIYMKDTWRFLSNSSVVMPEHEIYRVLHSHNTPNIPEHVAGGDIDGGKTRTQEFVDASWVCVKPRISPYQHYRLFHGIVGRALYKFECTRQLVSAVFDAVQAHSHAFEKAKLLHRDISAGNIILTEDGQGLLIDWELAKVVDEVGSRRPDRTGTWQFMSANLLKHPGKMHEFKDDLESFLHVLAWITLRYVPAIDSYSPGDRDDDLTKFDEVVSNLGQFERGGRAKADAFGAGTYPSRMFQPRRSTPLLKLLKTLSLPFKAFYGDPFSEEDREKVNVPPAQLHRNLFVLQANIMAYDQHIESLETVQSFTDAMEHALDKDQWPADDEADANLPGSFAITRNTRVKTTRLETSSLVNSKGLSRGSKRGASPTPESSGKRRRFSPATSEGHA